MSNYEYLENFIYLCNRTSMVEGKGVIEIIFISEILAKFQCREDNRQWHHIIGVYSPWGLSAYPLVWAIVFIRDKGNARSLTKGIKAISSHTFFIEKRYYLGIA